jgi:hypothetical protein
MTITVATPRTPTTTRQRKIAAAVVLALLVLATVVAVATRQATPTIPLAVAAPTACDPGTAAAYPALNGVSIEVNHPGPAVIDVYIMGRGFPRHLTQQVTKRGSGASFVFLRTAPVSSVSVSIENKAPWGITSCNLTVPDMATR